MEKRGDSNPSYTPDLMPGTRREQQNRVRQMSTRSSCSRNRELRPKPQIVFFWQGDTMTKRAGARARQVNINLVLAVQTE
jgi:hypothetical protein